LKTNIKIIIILSLTSFALGLYFVFGDLKLKSDNHLRIRGVDISNRYKGELNWKALKGNNDFVVLRAVREVDTCKKKGLEKFASIIDRKFLKNWASLKRHKIVRGAYHFFAKNVSAEEQFKVYSTAVKLEKGDLPPILDVEDRYCDMNEVFKWLSLAKHHYQTTPILYVDYMFYKVYLKDKNDEYPLWIYLKEDYGFEPSFSNPDCILWQYKQDQKVKGFPELVDFNVFLGDKAEFEKWLVH
jgi:lysozyme